MESLSRDPKKTIKRFVDFWQDHKEMPGNKLLLADDRKQLDVLGADLIGIALDERDLPKDHWSAPRLRKTGCLCFLSKQCNDNPLAKYPHELGLLFEPRAGDPREDERVQWKPNDALGHGHLVLRITLPQRSTLKEEWRKRGRPSLHEKPDNWPLEQPVREAFQKSFPKFAYYHCPGVTASSGYSTPGFAVLWSFKPGEMKKPDKWLKELKAGLAKARDGVRKLCPGMSDEYRNAWEKIAEIPPTKSSRTVKGKEGRGQRA